MQFGRGLPGSLENGRLDELVVLAALVSGLQGSNGVVGDKVALGLDQ